MGRSPEGQGLSRGFGRGLAPLALVAALCGAGPAGAGPITCRDDRALLVYPAGQAQFTVEIADTEEERARGLMQRASMPRSEGMLFIYPDEAERAFWMKNTLIPLDILFFDEAGVLVGLQENARPFDLTPLPSKGAARFVLEINGGLAAKLRITEGAQLAHPAIDPTVAVQPCE